MHPSDVLFQKFVPVIDHPGVLRTDTVELEHYTGRVTVRFKNFPGDVSRIEKRAIVGRRGVHRTVFEA